MLDEVQSLGLLKEHFVPVVSHSLCSNLEETLKIFKSWGHTPVVLKGCTKDASHKTELNLVKLNLDTSEAITSAFESITQSAVNHGVKLEGVIIAKQLKGERELMIGARLDPVFGAVVILGDGGKYVEAMPDVQVLLAPLSRNAVIEAISKLRIAPLFKGVRGEKGLDIEAFTECALRISDLIGKTDLGITQIDINPVITGAPGTGCNAVDAVIYQGSVKAD